MGASLQTLDPAAALLTRLKAEPLANFNLARPLRLGRAPGRLDVMGGIADYTGSLVCEATLNRAAAVALQKRDDRLLHVFSFNLHDEQLPASFRISLDSLATITTEALRREFGDPANRWAGYLVGCLYVLHERGYVNLRDPGIRGINLALLSTVPLGSGVSSSAAIEVATMIALLDHFQIPRISDTAASGPGKSETVQDRAILVDPMRLASLCQEVENRIVGAPCGIMDQVTSCFGQTDSLLRMVCQPHELGPALQLPPGVRVLGINSNVKHSVGGPQYGRTRCAAFIGHKIILDKMRQIGAAGGRQLTGDPMRGYLANLDPDDYKRIFRPTLPPTIKGGEFLMRYGSTVDKVTTVEPDTIYEVLHALDHHVLEARRVDHFVELLEEAGAASPGTRERGLLLDKAGHLMYASHLSYTMDAMLGADECDLLVQLVRERERAGLYGAKITGGGTGGTVAVLANTSDRATAAITEIMVEYEKRTGHKPESFLGSSPGAWHVGTQVV